MSYGILPSAQSVSTGFPYYLTRDKPWFQNYAQANQQYDGVMGYGFYGGTPAYGWGAFSTPSKPLAAVARPAEYAFSFDSDNFDGWHGVYGVQVGFGFCGGWVGYDYAFFGPQPRHSGGRNNCVVATRATDYGVGMANIGFLDGHSKAMKPGAIMQSNPALQGTLLY